ncbi:MAG: RHS repeat-associated core domain-containing protein [Pseudodesulfovibrio sp.]
MYDPFGSILADTNPALRIPIGFAGGLHDRDLGFVRFGWRDYDPFTSRWTAPDPMGEAGGDPDWYGYCLDDPVN